MRFFAVNSNDPERYPADSPEAMRERFEREGWPFPYLFDETQEAAREWGATVTPHLFVSTPSCGSARRARPTPTTATPRRGAAWLREALDAVLAGSEPPAEHRAGRLLDQVALRRR